MSTIVEKYFDALSLVPSHNESVWAIEKSLNELLLEGQFCLSHLWEQRSYVDILRFCKWSRLSWDCLQDASLMRGQKYCVEYATLYCPIIDEGMKAAKDFSGWVLTAPERERAKHYQASILFRRKLIQCLTDEGLSSVHTELAKELSGRISQGDFRGKAKKESKDTAKEQVQACIISAAYRIFSHKLLLLNAELKRENGPFAESTEDHWTIAQKAAKRVEALLDTASLLKQGDTGNVVYQYATEMRDLLLPQLHHELIDPLGKIALNLAVPESPLSGESLEDKACRLIKNVQKVIPQLIEKIERNREQIESFVPIEMQNIEEIGLESRPRLMAISEEIFSPNMPFDAEKFYPTKELATLILQHSERLPFNSLADGGENSLLQNTPQERPDVRSEIGEAIEGLLSNLAKRVAIEGCPLMQLAVQGKFSSGICDELIYRLGLERYNPRPVFERLHYELYFLAKRNLLQRNWGRLVVKEDILNIEPSSEAGEVLNFDQIDSKYWTVTT